MDCSEKIHRKTNPREKANIFSILTFIYTRSLFITGFKKDLEYEDLYEVTNRCRSKKCTDKLELTYFGHAKIKEKGKRVSIYKTLWTLYGYRYMALALLNMSGRLLLNIVEPEAVSQLVAYFKPGQIKMTIDDAIYYAVLMIGVKLVYTLYRHNYILLIQEMAGQIRISISSLIYRKALRLSPKSLEKTSLGNIVTVITKDVQQFDHAVLMVNNLWVSLIEATVMFYLVYRRCGISSLVGIVMVLGVVPFQAYTSKLIRNLRLKMTKSTDNRLQRTKEALSSIKTIKMYTWEQIFVDTIGEARLKELKIFIKASYLRMFLVISASLVTKLAFYSIIMLYIYLYHDMNAEDIFYVIKIFKSLKSSVGSEFSLGFYRLGEIIASLKRITKILQLDELPDVVEKPDDDPKVDLRNVSVILHKKDVLKNVSLTFKKGLNVITGELGSGKSSLIKVILRDYPIEDGGEVRIRGMKSYASQDPWLFPSSIRQNILFGEKYEHERYHQVISACALEYDFDILEKGDKTIVADGGMNLSKGQQARINLARSIYRNSDIYLIDDSLTALDTKVQEHIFHRCIRGLLKDKCVILVTHNSKHIQAANKLVVLENGAIKFVKIQDPIANELEEAIDDKESDNLNIKTIKAAEADYVNTNETTKLIKRKKSQESRKQIYREIKKTGRVDFNLYKRYVKMGGGFFMGTLLVIAYVGFSFFGNYSEKALTNWVNSKADITSYKETYLKNTTIDLEQLDIENKTTVFLNSTFNVSTHVIQGIEELELQASKALNLYTVMVICYAAIEFFRFYLAWKFGFNASIKVHAKMMKRVLNATMGFFDSYFIGNILNRFAQDLNVVDEMLVMPLSGLIGDVFEVAGVIGLIASVDWKFMIPAIMLTLFVSIVRTVYIRTGRSLKRLEAATRSPIVGHLNSTLEGLTTVRSYKAQEILRNEFDKHIDVYMSAYYSSITARNTFAFVMNMSAILFTCSVVIRFLFFESETHAGDVGLTLTQAANLSSIISDALSRLSDVENNMTSFERAMEYTTLETENIVGSEPEIWPSKGEITYEKVSLTYTKSNEQVLKNISFIVPPKTRIGIVGRTGAGKSSVISTLYRLYNYDGNIYIDGVELKTLSLKFLRQHISIIPQDPIMFSGTVRSNVDPLEEYTDEDVWKTLHKVHLDNKVSNLNAQVADVNFSTGQRQLICLARAIISKNKIVILDEATANMDPETEHLAQKVIDDNFANCTLLIIAHRLDAILGCDKIMVLNRGEIIEFDEPKTLLKDKSSLFSEMMKTAVKNE